MQTKNKDDQASGIIVKYKLQHIELYLVKRSKSSVVSKFMRSDVIILKFGIWVTIQTNIIA